jgi:hypothetical protein
MKHVFTPSVAICVGISTAAFAQSATAYTLDGLGSTIKVALVTFARSDVLNADVIAIGTAFIMIAALIAPCVFVVTAIASARERAFVLVRVIAAPIVAAVVLMALVNRIESSFSSTSSACGIRPNQCAKQDKTCYAPKTHR